MYLIFRIILNPRIEHICKNNSMRIPITLHDELHILLRNLFLANAREQTISTKHYTKYFGARPDQ